MQARPLYLHNKATNKRLRAGLSTTLTHELMQRKARTQASGNNWQASQIAGLSYAGPRYRLQGTPWRVSHGAIVPRSEQWSCEWMLRDRTRFWAVCNRFWRSICSSLLSSAVCHPSLRQFVQISKRENNGDNGQRAEKRTTDARVAPFLFFPLAWSNQAVFFVDAGG